MKSRLWSRGVVCWIVAIQFAATWPLKAQEMDVTVDIKLKEPKLVHQQSTDCTVVLTNKGRSVLHDINSDNLNAGPTIIMTDAETGQTSRFSTPKKPGGVYRPIDLRGGADRDAVFYLTQSVQFPGPGLFDLQAEYVWDNATRSAVSPPVRVELLSNRLEPHHIVCPTGGAAATYFATCTQEIQDKPGKQELWLANINTSTRPRVHNLIRLVDVEGKIRPYLSVPANTNPVVQWVAWIDKQKLAYLARKSEKISDVGTAKLDKRTWSIVPPILQNPPRPNESIAGADVLLYARDEQAAAGSLHVMRFDLTSSSMGADTLPLPGSMPTWWETAHAGPLRRLTFLCTATGGTTRLNLARWGATSAPKRLEDLASWPGHCLGGATWVTSDGLVVGAVVIETTMLKKHSYAFHTWNVSADGKFELGPTVPMTVPEGTKVRRAIVSVNIGQAPHALLDAGTGRGPWFYVAADGAAKTLPVDIAANGGVPRKVLFRRELDPTIMYVRPGWGFDFVKP